MTVVLDECANICKIDRLPQLASHLGSKSICVDAIFQSEAQTVAVWGPDRARALWGAATVRILGAGLQDYDFLTKISGLIGTHKIRERSYSWSSQGNTTSVQYVREPIMPVEDIGRLKKTNALLIRQEARPVLIDLVPWYTEPDSGDITERRDRATREVQDPRSPTSGRTIPSRRPSVHPPASRRDRGDPHLAELTALRAEVAQLSIRLSNTEHATQHLSESLDGIETQLLLALENTGPSAEEAPPQPAPPTAPIDPDRMDINVLTEWVDANIGRWAQRKLARHPGQAGFGGARSGAITPRPFRCCGRCAAPGWTGSTSRARRCSSTSCTTSTRP